jgi:hypothetical protein
MRGIAVVKRRRAAQEEMDAPHTPAPPSQDSCRIDR